jgi:hypothetical protein
MFISRSEHIAQRRLEALELIIKDTDNQLYSVSGSDIIVSFGEEIKKVLLVIKHDASANTLTPISPTNIVLQNSNKDVKLVGTSLSTNDSLIIKYIPVK